MLEVVHWARGQLGTSWSSYEIELSGQLNSALTARFRFTGISLTSGILVFSQIKAYLIEFFDQ